jgi:23S rRNA pseudouridine1911/1915/1917 synthase
MEEHIATVEPKDQHKRLDLFLALAFPAYSRTQVRKLLDTGKVKRNGEVEYRPNYKVEIGDKFEVEGDSQLTRKQLKPVDIKVDIVYQNEDIVVANKPSGLKVHPTFVGDSDSLLNALTFQLQDKLTEFGVNLVNRIDKETSGLVVAAISPTGAWHYAKQFAEGQARKHYLAVVISGWEKKFGYEEVRISNFLRYDPRHKMQSIVKDGGEFAETSFQLIQTDPSAKFSLISAFPKTGRTHQIRVHLAHIGFPIIGDIKYGGKDDKRLYLHAYELDLQNPRGENLHLQAGIPAEFTQLGFEIVS